MAYVYFLISICQRHFDRVCNVVRDSIPYRPPSCSGAARAYLVNRSLATGVTHVGTSGAEELPTSALAPLCQLVTPPQTFGRSPFGRFCESKGEYANKLSHAIPPRWSGKLRATREIDATAAGSHHPLLPCAYTSSCQTVLPAPFVSSPIARDIIRITPNIYRAAIVSSLKGDQASQGGKKRRS